MDSNDQNKSEEGKTPKDAVSKAISNTLTLRDNVQHIIQSFESIREKLYPVAEKIALIELEKDPYRIPGDPYKRREVKKVSPLKMLKDRDDSPIEDEENKDEANSEASDDSIEEDMFFD